MACNNDSLDGEGRGCEAAGPAVRDDHPDKSPRANILKALRDGIGDLHHHHKERLSRRLTKCPAKEAEEEQARRGMTPAEIKDVQVNDIIERIEEEQELSVGQLKNHIRQNHPMKTNEDPWPISVGTGAFFSFEAKRNIPECLKDIGLGASMYLLTLKALGKIFFFLSIFNLPAMWVFYSGTEARNREDLGGIASNFLMYSLGNLGD